MSKIYSAIGKCEIRMIVEQIFVDKTKFVIPFLYNNILQLLLTYNQFKTHAIVRVHSC